MRVSARPILQMAINQTAAHSVFHESVTHPGSLGYLRSTSTISTTAQNLTTSTTTASTTMTSTTTSNPPMFTLGRFISSLASKTQSFNSDHRNLTGIATVSSKQDFAVDVGGSESDLNTPLNAPEPSLEPVNPSESMSDSDNLSELAWILPIVLLSVCIMVGLAFVFYFAVRKLELRMLGWCYRNCGCCCTPGGGGGRRVLRGEQYDTLSEDTNNKSKKESVRLRDLREHSPSYGMT